MMRGIQSMLAATLYLDEINVRIDSNELVLHMIFKIGDKSISSIFRNVHDLFITELSFPMIIQGLQIVDNTEKGWENGSKYSVYDFENDTIRFCCAKIEIE